MFDIDRFAAGDPKHVEEVVRGYSPLVLVVCQSFARDYDHAQDLYQDTWKTVLARARSYGGDSSFRSWLYKVATNVCLSDRRAGQATADGMALYATQTTAGNGWTHVDPLAETERRELHRAIHRALPVLSEGQREALLLRVMEGRSTAEVAEFMGVTPATVRSHVRHALNRLRHLTEDPDNELSRHRATS